MRPILIGLAVLTLGFTPALIGATRAAPPLHAAAAGKGQAAAAKAERSESESTAERVLTTVERAILRDYFRTRETTGEPRKGLPPGLAKRETLPPGLAKKLERGGRLPPGLQARALPEDLERRLPRRNGTKRILVDGDVVLIEEGTRAILDILTGAAGGGN